MVFLLERLCTLATVARRLEQRARRNYDCVKPMDFAVTHLLYFVFWKNYSSYEMPAFGSDPS